METRVFANEQASAEAAAAIVAAEARIAAAERGRFVLALSGGRTPWIMLRALATEDVPWPAVHIVQVDERVAPAADPDRNLTHIRETLIDQAQVRPENLHPMLVESSDLAEAAREYAGTLAVIAGTPPEIDLVHLGLGPDGHAASLVPGDPVNEVTDRDVALTGVYQGRCRMTLTFPAINRARRVLWLVTGAERAEMLARLQKADASIPAGRVRQERAVIVANRAAVERA